MGFAKLEIIFDDGTVKIVSPDENIRVCDSNDTLSIKTPIVVNGRIPSNYGLITWNGSYLTVS